jgi:hypothetical protein
LRKYAQNTPNFETVFIPTISAKLQRLLRGGAVQMKRIRSVSCKRLVPHEQRKVQKTNKEKLCLRNKMTSPKNQTHQTRQLQSKQTLHKPSNRHELKVSPRNLGRT